MFLIVRDSCAGKESEVKRYRLCFLIGLFLMLFTFEGALALVRDVPSESYTTIQSAIDACEYGDTVLVGPGVYRENLMMRDVSVSLISTDGRDKTTIDAGGKGVGLTCIHVLDSTAVIRGFTFKNGAGMHGGGVFLSTAFLTVEGNAFVADSAKYGGGLCALWSNSSIRNNTFSGNRASYGGAIYTMFLSPEIDSNILEGNEALIGGGLCLTTSSEAKVSDNVIRGNRAEERGGGVSMNTAAPVFERNFLQDNRAEEGGGISCLRSGGIVRENVLWKNRAPRGGAIALADTLAPDIERNTVVFNSAVDTLCAGLYTTAPFARVVGNIFFGNSPGYAVYCAEGASPVLSCNILWDNETGDYQGIDVEAADLHVDPLFCNPEEGDFTVTEGSPARGGRCGSIGALGRGCEGAEAEE